MSATQKYDVAISFLARDEKIGAAIEERLRQSGLKVFFFPRNQEDLAGTNGMESMRQPFFEEARLIVVLFREPWGQTSWTRIEETAITESCLKLGWGRLFFVVLDAASKRPKWLPETHVRFNFEDYGLEQAVGAIKARVQEQGGAFRPPTAMDVAAQAKSEADYLRDREAFLRSDDGAREAATSADRIVQQMEAICLEIAKNHSIELVTGMQGHSFGVSNGRVSLFVDMTGYYLNDIRETALEAREFNGRLILPGERRMYFVKPELLRKVRFRPDLSLARELVWHEETNKGPALTEPAVADLCIQNFLALVQKGQRGELRDLRFD